MTGGARQRAVRFSVHDDDNRMFERATASSVDKFFPVGFNEGSDRHRRRSGDGFDDIVRSGKQALLKVQRDGAKMLKGLLGQSVLLQLADEILDLDGPVDYLATERIADRFRDSVPVHLYRPEEVVGLAGMRSWFRQDCGDHAGLVLRCDWGVTPVAERQVDQPLLGNVSTHPHIRISQPLSKEGRAKMRDGNARPIEYALGNPVIARLMAFRFSPG